MELGLKSLSKDIFSMSKDRYNQFTEVTGAGKFYENSVSMMSKAMGVSTGKIDRSLGTIGKLSATGDSNPLGNFIEGKRFDIAEGLVDKLNIKSPDNAIAGALMDRAKDGLIGGIANCLGNASLLHLPLSKTRRRIVAEDNESG